jgi:hypothetical protein
MKAEPDFHHYYDEKSLKPGDVLEEPLFDGAGQRHTRWIVVSCRPCKGRNGWCGYRMEIKPMDD